MGHRRPIANPKSFAAIPKVIQPAVEVPDQRIRRSKYRQKRSRLLPDEEDVLWPYAICQVVFDCDGTLLDTMPLYHEADVVVSQKSKRSFTERGLWGRLNGLGEADTAVQVIKEFELPLTTEQYIEKRGEALAELMRDASVELGAPKLVRDLKRKGIPMAVATSSARDLHEQKVAQRPDFFQYFEAMVTGDDVEPGRGKPHPDIFLKASRFPAQNVLVFGDAPNDVIAANSAGMPVVFLAHGEEGLAHIRKSGLTPTLTLNELFEFDMDQFVWFGDDPEGADFYGYYDEPEAGAPV